MIPKLYYLQPINLILIQQILFTLHCYFKWLSVENDYIDCSLSILTGLLFYSDYFAQKSYGVLTVTTLYYFNLYYHFCYSYSCKSDLYSHPRQLSHTLKLWITWISHMNISNIDISLLFLIAVSCSIRNTYTKFQRDTSGSLIVRNLR